MEIKSYFENIEPIIRKELLTAKNSIKIAMCYFTNSKLMSILANRSFAGVNVEIIIDFNSTINSKLISSLCALGCEVFITTKSKTMHHKFCIIDDSILINGSYNWTNRAKNNLENILIFKNSNTAIIEEFKYNFDYIKNMSQNSSKQIILSQKSIFDTPLIISRKNNTFEKLIWKDEESNMLNWTFDYSWHPLGKKEMTLQQICRKENQEPLLLENGNLINKLNYCDFSIKTKCSNCNKKLITRWFRAHLIKEQNCPYCCIKFGEKMNNENKSILEKNGISIKNLA